MEIAPDPTRMQPGLSRAPARPRRSRTRQGKLRLLTLDQLDARTAAAQGARQLIEQLIVDMEAGGRELTVGERQLATRAAMLEAVIGDFETRWVAGEQIALGDYFAAVNVQRRVLATLGLERRARDVTPSLDQIKAEILQERADG